MHRFVLPVLLGAGCPTLPADEPAPRPTRPPTPDACFADEGLVDFVVSDQGDLEATHRSPVDGQSELCAIGGGLGAVSDAHAYAYRYLVRDFDATVHLEALEGPGTAGVVLRTDAQSPDRARLALLVEYRDDGALQATARYRPEDGGPEEATTTTAMVSSLPASLRVVRVGTQLTASVGPDVVFDRDVGDAALDKGNLALGIALAAPDGVATAVFGGLDTAGPEGRPPSVEACPEPVNATASHGSRLTGIRMHEPVAVMIGGERATIVSQGASELTFVPGTERLHWGRVSLESDWGWLDTGLDVLAGGRSFVRGDVDGNGVVDEADVEALTAGLSDPRALARCLEAADVNDDDRIDSADALQLRAHLAGTGAAPAAPFPDPGFAPDGGPLCGLPPIPEAFALVDPDGSSLPAAGLQRGDEILLLGSALPDDLEVWFDDVRTAVVDDPTITAPDTVRLRVLEVPTSGTKCPRLVHDLTGLGPEARRTPRRGLVYDLAEATPDLCPLFSSDGLSNLTVADFDPDNQQMVLPVRPSAWREGERIRVDVQLPTGTATPGGAARLVSPVTMTWGADGTASLERLARIVRQSLGEDDACDCEISVEARPDLGGLLFEPCDPQITEPPGPLVPPGLPWKAVRPDLWSGTSFKAPTPPGVPVTCDDVGSFADDPRQFMWCRFAGDVVRPSSDGLPRWEFFHPKDVLYAYPNITSYFESGLEHPSDRAVADKYFLLDGIALSSAFGFGYDDACVQAAHAAYCEPGSEERHLPPLDAESIVVKTFWLTEDQLPASADPSHYYQYDSPQGRRYLGGMHVNTGTGDPATHWRWATFWVARPVGDTTNKAGGPLRYNDLCTEGTLADQPEGLPDPWQHYLMCVDDTGNTNCGNPWGPPNECLGPDLSCTACHSTHYEPVGSRPPVETAWLPSLSQAAQAGSCLDAIQEARQDGERLYEDLAPACKD